MNFETIRFEIKDHVGWLTLNRPESMNARNTRMRSELVEVYDMVARDPGVRVLVLTGEGRAFCAGRDLKEVASSSPAAGQLEQRRLRQLERADTDVLANLPIPTIAAVNGFALGGGCEMALACDLRIASERAEFGLTEVKRGMIPGSGGTQRLARLVGAGPALTMILRGQRIPAQEAKAIGLVGSVVPAEELLTAAAKLAEEIAENAPLALRFAKEAVKRGLEMPLADGLQLERDLSLLLQSSEDFLEGARAFAEKRAPQWQGK